MFKERCDGFVRESLGAVVNTQKLREIRGPQSDSLCLTLVRSQSASVTFSLAAGRCYERPKISGW